MIFEGVLKTITNRSVKYLVLILKADDYEQALVLFAQEEYIRGVEEVLRISSKRIKFDVNKEIFRLIRNYRNRFLCLKDCGERNHHSSNFIQLITIKFSDVASLVDLAFSISSKNPDIRERIRLFDDSFLTNIFNIFTFLLPLQVSPNYFDVVTCLSMRLVNLKQFPQQIIFFLNLRILDLSLNRITNIPENVFDLKHRLVFTLEYLVLFNNFLIDLPQSICNLKRLNFLSVCCNLLSELPANFGRLQSLVKLCLTKNKLSFLPPSILTIPNLKCYIEKNLFDQKTNNKCSGINSIPSLYELALNVVSKLKNNCEYKNIIFKLQVMNRSKAKRPNCKPTIFNIVIESCTTHCLQLGSK